MIENQSSRSEEDYFAPPSAEGQVRCRHCGCMVPQDDAVDLRSTLPKNDEGLRWACKPCAIAAGIGAD